MRTTCHDCKKTIKKGERYMPYHVGHQQFMKCASCHETDPVLRNFKETEVYSRVVGYIRPVQQWNKGKQAEYKNRVEYCPESGV